MWTTIPQFEENKSHLRVLLLGSYERRKKKFLQNLKAELREKGYENCRLVEDFSSLEGEEWDSYEKSKHWVESADICIYLFFERGHNEGSLIELLAQFIKIKTVKKIYFAYNERSMASWVKQGKASSLFPGFFNDFQGIVPQIKYRAFKELVTKIDGQLINSVVESALELSSRKSGEWELSST